MSLEVTKVKFVVKEQFRHGYDTFEVGDSVTYSSDDPNVTPQDIELFHKAGWISIEGREDNKLDLTPKQLEVRSAKHKLAVTKPA